MEQHEAPKIRASKKKHMKLSIRGYCKKADTKGNTTRSMKIGKFKTGR